MKKIKSYATQRNDSDRFRFGENWQNFLTVLNEDRIVQAETSIKSYLEVDTLQGMTFLDVGSGSGLFSLAARRLGATVYSFDYDPQSVACTKELRQRFFKNDTQWNIEQASVLDNSYIEGLKKFDIVYSWGVLHHSGDMWNALDNVSKLVKDDGKLFISIYNYQPYLTNAYIMLKKSYNKSSLVGKKLIAGSFIFFQMLKYFFIDIFFFRRSPRQRYINKIKDRGMSYYYDWIDWIGGYPFEVAKPDDILGFFYQKKFILTKLKTVGGGHACNEFLFLKNKEREYKNF